MLQLGQLTMVDQCQLGNRLKQLAFGDYKQTRSLGRVIKNKDFLPLKMEIRFESSSSLSLNTLKGLIMEVKTSLRTWLQKWTLNHV